MLFRVHLSPTLEECFVEFYIVRQEHEALQYSPVKCASVPCFQVPYPEEEWRKYSLMY